jgi:signal transduction histidine kinase
MKILLFFLSNCFSIFSIANHQSGGKVQLLRTDITDANDPDFFMNSNPTFLLSATGWEAVSFKAIAIIVLVIVAFIFYYKLGTLKNHFKDLEDDVSKQTEGLRASNTILAKKNEEIYKQVSKIIAQQELILRQNFQLEYKAESLRRLNLSKDHLIATLISDLENPIVSLSEIAESLNEALPRLNKKEIGVFLNTIHGCSYDINSTLSNLVNWEQLQTRQRKHNPVDFYIGDVIKSNVISLTQELTQKQLQIDFQVDDDHKVIADQEMINVVFKNLLVCVLKTIEGKNILINSAETENKIVISVSYAASVATTEQCENILNSNVPNFSGVSLTGPFRPWF